MAADPSRVTALRDLDEAMRAAWIDRALRPPSRIPAPRGREVMWQDREDPALLSRPPRGDLVDDPLLASVPGRLDPKGPSSAADSAVRALRTAEARI